jgi:hypothetical protein
MEDLRGDVRYKAVDSDNRIDKRASRKLSRAYAAIGDLSSLYGTHLFGSIRQSTWSWRGA